jgi:hypothetical protein
MGQGVIISAVAHVTALLLAVLFTGANPFDSVATEAIAVDIISPGEVPPDQPQAEAPEAPPAPPQESPPDLFPLFDPAMTSQPPTPLMPPPTATKSAAAGKRAQQAAQPRLREQQGGSAPPSAAPRAAAEPPPPAAPAPPQALLPVQAPLPAAQETSTEAREAAAQATDQGTNVAGLFGMPLTLPDGRLGGGFDAPATETAKIERGAVDAFRAHLKTCAALPTGISPAEKISLVVRVTLKADGTLAAQPTLIEASASPKGPVILQSLLRGLQKCQPYNMLPADKYQEWKTIDMRFTPADMGEG